MTTKITFLDTNQSQQPILEESPFPPSFKEKNTLLINHATDSILNPSDQERNLSEISVTIEEDLSITSAQIASQLGLSDKISITFPSGVAYEGEWKNNMPDGHGKMTFSNEESHEGTWVNGQKHGYGIYITSSFKYSGDFFEGKLHGKGELICSNNGDKYIGDFFEDKFHGKGEYTYTNGDKYIGDFFEDKFHGKGELTHANGTKYVGDFFEDKPHGKGELIYASGDIYAGDFFEGKSHGKGESIYPSGNKYTGNFSEGKRHGKGEFIYIDRSRYVGDFYEGKGHGKGEFIHADGSRSVGDFYEDKFHGKGEFICPNGNKYIGDFFEGNRYGKGELIYTTGEKYEGNFAENKKHGRFTYTDQHGILHAQVYAMDTCTYSKRFTAAQVKDYKDKKKEEERKNKLAAATNQPTEKSIDKLAASIEGSYASKKSRKKKTSDPIPTENEPANPTSNPDASEIPKEKILETDHTKPSLPEKTENRDTPTIKEKISRLLSEGKHHLPKPHSRVSRWRCSHVISQMEDFQDGTEHKYCGMTPEKKQEMILFHEAGSSLDPIIFHPDIKNLYTYPTDTGIGCYAEIIRGGHTYQGVILFGINDNSICYHRMFEPRNNFDFLSLTMHQFFDVKSENKSFFPTLDDVFYTPGTENQLLYSNNLYELDEKTGIFSLHDTRENIQATIRILPLDTVTRRLARRSIDPNLFFTHHSPLHNAVVITSF